MTPDFAASKPAAPAAADPPANRCRSCGAPIMKGRRRYCDRECRQRLMRKLAVTTSLLCAMNTRCASFSFNDSTLVLSVVVYGDRRAFTYFWPRSRAFSPADDLALLTEHLGRTWWSEHDKRRCRVQASREVLARAEARPLSAAGVIPIRKHSPRVGSRTLTVLSLDRSALAGPDPLSAVKTAFRRQALRHHPDAAGDPAMFRRVYEAYAELLEWIRNPVHTRRSGLPGKWSFNGARWTAPLANR